MKKLCLLPVYVLYGLLVITRASRECVTSVCEPAEEGTRHTITFAFSLESNSSIDISAYYIPAGTCYVNKSCSNLFPNRYNISRSQNKAFELVEVTIYNVTKKYSRTNKIWFMVNPSRSYFSKRCVCLQTVFTRATDSYCSKLITDDDMRVACFTEKVYPPAICRFLLRINNTIIDTPSETWYEHETLPGNATYFESICSIIVPKRNLSPGVYAIEVTIYPNVTNDDTDVKYGRKVSLSFTLDILSNNQSIHVNRLLVITGTASLIVIISIVVAISCFCSRKVPCRPTETQNDVSTGTNEEIVHEDIQLRDERQFPSLNIVDGQRLEDTLEEIEGTHHYDVVEYSLSEDGHQFYSDGTTVRSNQYDVLYNDSMSDYHEYNDVASAERLGLSDNEYITVIDETFAFDDC